MASKPNNVLLSIACLAISAVLFFFGTGLHPLWPFAWFALIPVLWIAPRVSRGAAFGIAVFAYALGGLNGWGMTKVVITISVFFLSIFLPGCLLGIATLLFCHRIRRGSIWQAALIVPVFWVACEFLNASFSPHSTAENLAYSQMNFLPILQIASITGIWGISFCIFLFAATVAALLSQEASTQKRSLAIAAFVFFVCVFGFGFWRLAATPKDSPTVKVGLISSDAPGNVHIAEPEKAGRLFSEYAAQADALAAQGAQVIVIPEKTGLVLNSTSASVDKIFGDAAARNHVSILAGVLRIDKPSRWNEARLYSPDGSLEALYEKHHMVPRFESDLTVGKSRVTVARPSGTWGVIICKDMDFPLLSRQYANDGAGLMLAPAWDFVIDGWQHGRMAILRGVEDGFSIARAPKQGILTVTDDRGRVIAERNTNSAPFATVIATVPVRHDETIYTRFGDWFAWLDLAALIVLLGMPLISRH